MINQGHRQIEFGNSTESASIFENLSSSKGDLHWSRQCNLILCRVYLTSAYQPKKESGFNYNLRSCCLQVACPGMITKSEMTFITTLNRFDNHYWNLRLVIKCAPLLAQFHSRYYLGDSAVALCIFTFCWGRWQYWVVVSLDRSREKYEISFSGSFLQQDDKPWVPQSLSWRFSWQCCQFLIYYCLW